MRHRVNAIIPLACALRRFQRDRSGASAVEFALVAPLMLIGIFAILELTLMFVAAQVLQTGTQIATRQIMTGQVKSTTMSKEQFKAIVCANVNVLLNCTNLYVDAQAYSNMTEPTFPDPLQNNKFVDNT